MDRTYISRGFLIGVPAACLAACASLAGPFGSAGNRILIDRVDALVAPLVAANEFSGAIVMVRGGRVVYKRGFGMANHAAGLVFTPDTPADGGSLAKTFTAAGLWWLAHEGKVDLDAGVQRYVPEYPHAQTTVKQLLSHSNGLPMEYEFFDAYFGKEEVRTTAAMLKVVGRQAPRPSFEPGTQYEYSNLGFDAAALVIERITGQSYEAFVKERFFSRLGLESSFARPARLADWRGVRTVGYRWRDGAWQLNDSSDNEGFLGASNLYFSAADLARWGSANASGAALPRPVFESGQVHLPVAGLPLPVTGLSWYCDDRKVRCNYTGHNAGFHGFVLWDRERNETVAFISNSTLPAWKTASLQRELVNALAGRAPDVDPPAAFIEVYKAAPAEVTGTYVASGLPPITLTAVDGQIKMRWGDGLAFDAYPAAKQVLYVPGLDFYLAFSGTKAARTLHIKSQERNLSARRS
jgi:CubicO group peptidase (beta-lactamase class C family)